MLGLTLAATLVTSVPFSLRDHRIFVNASIGRAGPFAMIVDTGSSGLVISPETARSAGILGKPAGYLTGAGSGHTAAALATIRGLRLGTLQFPATQGYVSDLSAIRRFIGFDRLDGVIGYEQLSHFRVLVNMDDRRLTFSTVPIRTPAGGTETPFTLDGGLPLVRAAVDGVHGTFLVDTGDRSQLTLFGPFARANDFYHFATVRNALTGIGVGGPIYSDLLKATLQAFGTTSAGVNTRAPVGKQGVFSSDQYAGSIGNGFLERFNVVFDYPKNRMIVWPARHVPADTSLFKVPAAPAAPPEPLARHALFGAAATLKNGGVMLTFVAPGGAAAAAGLRVGDVIHAVGTRAVSTTADYYEAFHDAPAGRPVDVAFERNAALAHATVTLGTAPDEADPGVKTLYEQVVVDNSLRRTIVTLPEGAARPLPAVLIVGGIGCFSVDAASNGQDTYLRLAHDLARAGYVAMRLEKSGVGDSQGPPCAQVDFEAAERGYDAALSALTSNPLVDPKHVFVFGHSIGTTIAPRLALAHSLAGIVIAEAVGRDWPEYELRNTRRELELSGEGPVSVDRAVLEKAQCMQKLLFEYEAEADIERDTPSCSVHNGVYPVGPAYMQQVAHLDILEPWTQMTIPVLAIYGTSDFVTEQADHQRIVDAVNAAHAGLGSLVTIDGMSHLLRVEASPRAAMDDFNKGALEAYDDALSETVVRWLKHLVE